MSVVFFSVLSDTLNLLFHLSFQRAVQYKVLLLILVVPLWISVAAAYVVSDTS